MPGADAPGDCADCSFNERSLIAAARGRSRVGIGLKAFPCRTDRIDLPTSRVLHALKHAPCGTDPNLRGCTFCDPPSRTAFESPNRAFLRARPPRLEGRYYESPS